MREPVDRLLPERSRLVRDSDFALTFEVRDAAVKRGDELAQLLDEPLVTDLGVIGPQSFLWLSFQVWQHFAKYKSGPWQIPWSNAL